MYFCRILTLTETLQKLQTPIEKMEDELEPGIRSQMHAVFLEVRSWKAWQQMEILGLLGE